MNYYIAIVHKDEDSAYGVTFPDIPGCYSAADRLEDVVPNAIEALDLWFEDQEEVVPSTADAILANSAPADAFLIAVPYSAARRSSGLS